MPGPSLIDFIQAVARSKQQYPRFNSLPLALTTGTGPGYSETYPPTEDYNPQPGKWTVQMRDPKTIADVKHYPSNVSLEAIHGLEATDPGYQSLTRQFIASMTPEQIRSSREVYNRDTRGSNFMNTGKPESFDSFMNRVQGQEYIRGGIFTDVIPNWVGPKGEGRYTPNQMSLLEHIKQYLQTPAAIQEGFSQPQMRTR